MRRIVRNVRAQSHRLWSALYLVGWHRKSNRIRKWNAVLSTLQIAPHSSIGSAMDPGCHQARRSCAGLPSVYSMGERQVLPQLGSRSTGTRSGTENRRHGGHPTLSVDTPQNHGEGDYRGWGLGGMGDGNATSASSLRSAASGDGQHVSVAHSLRSFVSRPIRVAHLHLRVVEPTHFREGFRDQENGHSAETGNQGNRSDAQGGSRERRMSTSWETLSTQCERLKTISRLTGQAVWVHAGVSSGGCFARMVRTARNMLLQSSIISLAPRSLQDRFSFWVDRTPIPPRTNRFAPAKLATAMASWAASKVWP